MSWKKKREYNYKDIAANSIFGNALDDSDDDNETHAKSIRTLKDGSVNYVALMEKDKVFMFDDSALDKLAEEEDDINDYDAHYDSIQESRKRAQELKNPEKDAKYASQIMQAAEARKREQWLNYEKVAALKMSREGKDTDEGMKFMGEAYRNKLEEAREFEKLNQIRDEYDKKNSIAGQSGMRSFFRNMLSDRIEEEPVSEPKPMFELSLNIIKPPEKDEEDVKIFEPLESHSPVEVATLPSKAKQRESKSRSRSKEREQMRILKSSPKKKETSREEKLRLAKERFLSRKPLS